MSATLFTASFALAGPDLTPEQRTKAREVASQLKPPVDFDALLAEADRLGVICEGNLTIRGNIKTCINGVKIAQSKERQAKLDAESARLDEENARLDEEAIRMINEISDKAEQKLKQNQ